MKIQLKTLATLALVSALSAGLAQTTASGTTGTTTHKRTTRRPPVAKKPSLESQIESLRNDMNSQIQQLKQQLSDRDQQLQQAQQAAAAAQAAATQAQQQAAQQSAALTENTQAVGNLQGAVTDLKTNSTSLATTIQEQQTKVEKQIEHPDVLHYKGATITPGGFMAAETVYRSAATGGGLNTAMTGIPLEHSAQGQYSEFYGSGRQSRVAMLVEGKPTPDLKIGGYVEADFLSAGVTSNNNESNSYTLRQRQAWAQAALTSGWTFTGGQMWSLVTETTKGLQNRSEILPSTIDPQYEAGFVWERQYGFRVTKDFGHHLFLGASAENAQIPSVVGHGIPLNFIVGQAGTGGGLYNSTANYASNVAPDFVAKVAIEPPGWGHWELFGVGRFFRARVYPNAVYTTVNGVTTASGSSAGAFNDTTTVGGVGGGFRIPTLSKHLDVGLKGLYGDGIGRYGDAQIADTTVRPNGQLAPIHGFSALSTLEFHVTPRLDIYFNYGGDYVGRRYFLTSPTKSVGYGSYLNVETGCGTEPVPGTTTTGYTPGSQSNCTADTKDVQEFTGGYWYDFYKGPAGRLRQGIQYSYFERNIWSGIGPTPKGTDNGLWTSFRYYLP
jgi:hypothetical protein